MPLSLVGRFLFENSEVQLSQVQAKNWSRDSQNPEKNALEEKYTRSAFPCRWIALARDDLMTNEGDGRAGGKGRGTRLV
jgi:hypothetical protein